MTNFTSNTYTLKRKILTFTNKISRNLSKPERKFTADITYGMLASGSCLLTDVCDQLHEPSKKINVVDRLSHHLEKGTPASVASAYLQQIKKWVSAEPVIHIDDSDVVKPDGYKFESLGIVRDGSASTSTKNVYKKGYHVTEACVLTSGNHPVSIFSKIHSSHEKDYKSANTITFHFYDTTPFLAISHLISFNGFDHLYNVTTSNTSNTLSFTLKCTSYPAKDTPYLRSGSE